ncbi:MAG: hypothetical protein ACT4PI_15100 [Actinomycetota bacterium]
MSRTRRAIVAGVVVTAALAVVAALTTGTLRRVLGADTETTADVAPALPTETGGGPPPSDDGPAGTPPGVGDASADSPTGATGAPEVFDTAAVSLTDDDGGAAMFALANAAPGTGDTGCITVTYNGGSDATVRLYGTTGGTGLDRYLDLTITRGSFPSGTPPFDSCTGFVSDTADYFGAGAGVVFDGTLDAYPDNYDTGIADPPGAPDAWADAETHAYQFAITVADNNAAQGLTASQAFTWEARGEEPLVPSGPVPVVEPTSGPPGTVVTVGSGSDPCVPPSGTLDPRVRVWISAPETGEALAEVTLPVAADGSWLGTITIPESAAAFSAVDLQASCSPTTGGTVTAAATTVYHLYTAVSFAMAATPAGPATPAEPAAPVPANPTFVG